MRRKYFQKRTQIGCWIVLAVLAFEAAVTYALIRFL